MGIEKVFNFIFKTSGEDKVSKALSNIGRLEEKAQKMARARRQGDKRGRVSNEELNKSFGLMSKKIFFAAEALKAGKELMDSWAQSSPFFALQQDRIADATSMFQMVIGDALAPALEIVADFIWALYDAYENLSPEMKEAINVGILVVGMVTGLSLALTVLNWNMVIILAAIIVIAAIWYVFGDSIMHIVNMLSDILMPLFEGFTQFIDELFQDPFGAITDAFGNLLSFIQNTEGTLGALMRYLFAPFQWFLDQIDALFKTFDLLIQFFEGKISFDELLLGLVNVGIDLINDFVKMLWAPVSLIGNILWDISSIEIPFIGFPFWGLRGIAEMMKHPPALPQFEEGGFVGGKPIPIIAHEGELILNAAQQQSVAGAIRNQSNDTYNINLNSGARSGRFMGNDLRRSLMQQGLG